jgi:hypothetical protein
LIGTAFVHEARRDLDSNWRQPGRSSVCAVGLAAFPLEIHDIQKVTSRLRIAR